MHALFPFINITNALAHVPHFNYIAAAAGRRLMEYPHDYFGSASDRSQLAARRPPRDTRKESRSQASSVPYHPYAHEQYWRSRRLPTTNYQQLQAPPPNEQQNGRRNHQAAGAAINAAAAFGSPVNPAPLSSYRRILLLGPSPSSSNASDRLVSHQNRNEFYVSSSQYLPSRCEINDGGHEAPVQYFRREAVGKDNDGEKVTTVNFLGAMAARMDMLPRAKDMDVDDDGEKSKHAAGLDVSLHL